MKAALLAALLAAAGGAHAQRTVFDTGNGNFTEQGLLLGVAATQAQCAQVMGAVWARLPSGEAECIRYWASGLQAVETPGVLVYLPGDQLFGESAWPGYTQLNPASMQKLADGMQARTRVPFILLSRPGIFGSSGEHRQRRRPLEPRLVSAALDEIKARHRIGEFALVGQSGGGHSVASLLGWRSDIVCAVPTSSVSSPRLRWDAKGLARDVTGHADSYEPGAHLRREVLHPRLRVFVLGDPKDSNTPWATQTPLADQLRRIGVAVDVLTGEGLGGESHMLGSSGQAIGALCLRGAPTPQILEFARNGLKG